MIMATFKKGDTIRTYGSDSSEAIVAVIYNYCNHGWILIEVKIAEENKDEQI